MDEDEQLRRALEASRHDIGRPSAGPTTARRYASGALGAMKKSLGSSKSETRDTRETARACVVLVDDAHDGVSSDEIVLLRG